MLLIRSDLLHDQSLTVVLLDGSSDGRFLYGILMTLKDAVDRTT